MCGFSVILILSYESLRGEEWPELLGRPALMFCFGFIDVLVLPQGKHSAVPFGVTSGCVWGGDGGTLNWHR